MPAPPVSGLMAAASPAATAARSIPAENTRSPAPVSTTARVSSSPSIPSKIADSCTAVSMSMAFARSGRSMTTNRTAPCCWLRTPIQVPLSGGVVLAGDTVSGAAGLSGHSDTGLQWLYPNDDTAAPKREPSPVLDDPIEAFYSKRASEKVAGRVNSDPQSEGAGTTWQRTGVRCQDPRLSTWTNAAATPDSSGAAT